MSVVCLVTTDLSRIRLLAGDTDEVWTAPTPDDPDHPAPLRDVAAEAAEWLAARVPGNRIDLVCLDVDESRCVWISAPTREPAVIAAALRQRRADWGEGEVTGELVQPLVASATSGSIAEQLPMLGRLTGSAGKGDAGVPSAAVFETPDAAVRLLFEALDVRGIRLGDTCSLWHALARTAESASPGDDTVSAVLMVDRDDRLVWAWAESGGLVAGGVCHLQAAGEHGHDPEEMSSTIGRLCLDWLTWSAQLGKSPERVHIVARDPGALADTMRARWNTATVTSETATEPLRGVLAATEATGARENDARCSTPALSRRSSLSHRRVYRLATVTIGIFAIGVAGLGVRSQQAASRYEAAREQLNFDARGLVVEIAPGFEAQPDLVESLKSYFVQLKRDNPELSVPPPPRRIYAELDRLLKATVAIDGVTVNRISIEDRTCAAHFRIATYADGERLMTLLEQSGSEDPGTLSWTDRVTGSPPDLVIRLTGLWQ